MMSQSKNSNRTPLKPRWILCTKWSNDNRLFWTPIGTYEHYLKRRKVSGIPFSYDDQAEAIVILNGILADRPEIANMVEFCLLEVKYVPSKIKGYNEYWRNKYVLNEVKLQIENNKVKQ